MRPSPLLAAVEPLTHRRLGPGLRWKAYPLEAAGRRGGVAEAEEGEVAVRLRLERRTRRPRVLIDGHIWEEVRWCVTPNGDGWNGVAILGLEHLPVGRHQVRIEPAGHPVMNLELRHPPE